MGFKLMTVRVQVMVPTAPHRLLCLSHPVKQDIFVKVCETGKDVIFVLLFADENSLLFNWLNIRRSS